MHKGEKITLPSNLGDKTNPPPNYLKWSRLKDGKGVFVGLWERGIESSSERPVADPVNFALTDNGDLEIKHTDESLEGEYQLSHQNIVLTCVSVRISRPLIQGTWT